MKQPKKIDDTILLSQFNSGMTGRQMADFHGCSPAAVSKRLKRLTPQPPKALDDLTTKQAAVVKRIVAGESPTAAVEACYNTTTRHSARSLATQIMAVPGVQLAVEEELERAGLGRRNRISKLAEFVESPDPSVGLKALKSACEMGNDFPIPTTRSLNINVVCPVDLSEYQM